MSDRRYMNDSLSRALRLHESTIRQGDRSFVRRLSLSGVPDKQIEYRLAATSRMQGDRLTYAREVVKEYHNLEISKQVTHSRGLHVTPSGRFSRQPEHSTSRSR